MCRARGGRQTSTKLSITRHKVKVEGNSEEFQGLLLLFFIKTVTRERRKEDVIIQLEECHVRGKGAFKRYMWQKIIK